MGLRESDIESGDWCLFPVSLQKHSLLTCVGLVLQSHIDPADQGAEELQETYDVSFEVCLSLSVRLTFLEKLL